MIASIAYKPSHVLDLIRRVDRHPGK
jgi:hypothetical protein